MPAREPGYCVLVRHRVGIGVSGFEPPTSWSQTKRSDQAELHPGTIPATRCYYTGAVGNRATGAFSKSLYSTWLSDLPLGERPSCRLSRGASEPGCSTWPAGKPLGALARSPADTKPSVSGMGFLRAGARAVAGGNRPHLCRAHPARASSARCRRQICESQMQSPWLVLPPAIPTALCDGAPAKP